MSEPTLNETETKSKHAGEVTEMIPVIDNRKTQETVNNDEEEQQCAAREKSTDIGLQLQKKTGLYTLYKSEFYIRICMLILSILLILLSLSYVFGSISSTELQVVTQCPGYNLTDIWQHSYDVTNSPEGEPENGDKCWQTSSLKDDVSEIFTYNIYQFKYKDSNNAFAIFQCIIFSLFTCFCLFTLMFGVYTLTMDIQIIKSGLYKNREQTTQYTKPSNDSCISKVLATFKSIKAQYDKHFGIDTNGYISRMIAVEVWEILLQTSALLLYNGFNIFDQNG
eukprot:382210_1